jgi:hypothetical protein
MEALIHLLSAMALMLPLVLMSRARKKRYRLFYFSESGMA